MREHFALLRRRRFRLPALNLLALKRQEIPVLIEHLARASATSFMACGRDLHCPSLSHVICASINCAPNNSNMSGKRRIGRQTGVRDLVVFVW
ncbi:MULTISPECIES: hypothetical protein [unclassified Burkholderia]|uniref:hypothetical protein n=1 Tax=unclassified Burkholderia TaxID=2613784 RepID=UPI0011474650|nr:MULTISPECIES: hypothetical protein [unclassified Burkholderia]